MMEYKKVKNHKEYIEVIQPIKDKTIHMFFEKEPEEWEEAWERTELRKGNKIIDYHDLTSFDHGGWSNFYEKLDSEEQNFFDRLLKEQDYNSDKEYKEFIRALKKQVNYIQKIK